MEAGLTRAGIERRFLTNSSLTIGTRVVTAVLSLVTIPVLVSRFGVAGYGTWEALLATASLTSVFQAAVSGTLVWRVAEAFGRGDKAEIQRVAGLGAGATGVLFVLVWPLAWILREPVVRMLGVPAETSAVVAEMFPVVAALLLLGGLSETLEAVVSGCQHTGLVNVVSAVAQILNYSTVIALILSGGGFWSLVAGQAVGFVSRLIGAWIAARVAYGPTNLWPIFPRLTDLAMVRYSGWLTVGSVASALRDQTDKVVLASLASPAWVGYYGIAARLSGLVMEIIRFFYLPILTAVGALNAMGDWDGVRRLYSRLMSIVSVTTGLIVVIVAGLADRLIVLWIGSPMPEATLLLWLLIAGAATAAVLTGPGTAICRGCGRPGIEATYLAVNLILNLILTVTLVLLIGPVGTAVATGSTWALSSVLFLFVLHRSLALPVSASRRAVAAILLAVCVAFGTYWLSRALGLPETRREALVSVLILGSVTGSAYLGLAAAFRLVVVGEVFGGIRSLVWRAP